MDTGKIEYKYKVEVNQSLTSGMMALHGTYRFDDVKEADNARFTLMNELESMEDRLKTAGYTTVKELPKIIEEKKKELGKEKTSNNNNGTKIGNYTTAKKVDK